MKVPVIDFQHFDSGDADKLATLTREVDSALSMIGFIPLTTGRNGPACVRLVFAASHH